MTSPEPRAPLDEIRRTAELAVDAASLRVVAKEIRMSAMGLRSFIRGEHTPQPRTIRKLNTWYAARVAAGGEAGENEARIVLTLLARFYPRADRARVVRNFLHQMEREFLRSGMAPPEWLATLRAELPRDTGEAG